MLVWISDRRTSHNIVITELDRAKLFANKWVREQLKWTQSQTYLAFVSIHTVLLSHFYLIPIVGIKKSHLCRYNSRNISRFYPKPTGEQMKSKKLVFHSSSSKPRIGLTYGSIINLLDRKHRICKEYPIKENPENI